MIEQIKEIYEAWNVVAIVEGIEDVTERGVLMDLVIAVPNLLDELEKRDKVLKDCLAFVEPQVEHHGYGFFPGGNPNLFCPDGEMNTPQEIENWKEACKRWNEGNTNGEPSSHVPLFMGDKVVGSATVARLGMGSYVDVDEDAKTLVDSILTTLSKEVSHE